MSIRSPLKFTRWLYLALLVGITTMGVSKLKAQAPESAKSPEKVIIQSDDLFDEDDEADVDPLKDKILRRPIYIGPVFGYNRAMHSANIASRPESIDDPECPTFENGGGNGFFAGLSVEYILGNYKTSTSSLIFRFLYNTLPTSFSKLDAVTPTRLANMTIEKTNVEHKYEVEYNIFTFEPMYKTNVLSRLGLVVGPSFGFSMTNTREQTMALVSPTSPEAYFDIPKGKSPSDYSADRRTYFVSKKSDIPNVSKFRLGIKFGAQYEILLKGYYLVPNVHYNFGITQLSSNETWRVNALQLGIDIRFPWNILPR